jgi:hypothetical protein
VKIPLQVPAISKYNKKRRVDLADAFGRRPIQGAGPLEGSAQSLSYNYSRKAPRREGPSKVRREWAWRKVVCLAAGVSRIRVSPERKLLARRTGGGDFVSGICRETSFRRRGLGGTVHLTYFPKLPRNLRGSLGWKVAGGSPQLESNLTNPPNLPTRPPRSLEAMSFNAMCLEAMRLEAMSRRHGSSRPEAVFPPAPPEARSLGSTGGADGLGK